ncbi:MAG: DUF1802 family protein [Microcoleaceae cyanobacterium]
MLSQVLKEWHVAVQALQEGKTVLLLRKGGIREQNSEFFVDHRQVLLYPTFEHQRPELLQSGYRYQVQLVNSGWHPETVQIQNWAEITQVLSLETYQVEPLISQLLSFLIWNESFVRDRLNWKPEKPLHFLFMRVYHLPEIHEIPYYSSYGGCRSWIQLKQQISIENSTPSLTTQEYIRITSEITNCLKSMAINHDLQPFLFRRDPERSPNSDKKPLRIQEKENLSG